MIVKGILRVDVVAQKNVRDLEGKHRVQIALLFGLFAVRGGNCRGVQQALRDQNRVADRERFQRFGEQRPYLERTICGDLVVRKNVVRQQFKRLVKLAGGVDQTSLVASVAPSTSRVAWSASLGGVFSEYPQM